MREPARGGGHFPSFLSAIGRGALFSDAAFPMVFGAAYVFSFIWIFLIPADFWDDLAIKNNPDLVTFGYQAGLPTSGWFFKFIVGLPAPNFLGRCFVFLLFIVVALLIRRFTARLSLAPERERNAIAIFSVVLPLFLSRFQLVTTYYCLSLLLFWAASLMLARVADGPMSIRTRVVAGIFFVLSFFTQSFLVLYGFVLLLIVVSVVIKRHGTVTFLHLSKAAAALAARVPDMLFLPIAFFFLKAWSFPAVGPLVGYNAVTLSGMANALAQLPFTAAEALFNMADLALTVAGLTVALLCFALIGLRESVWRGDQPGEEAHTGWLPILVAFGGLMLAVFPYSVVSRFAVTSDFDDRNQLTMIGVVGALLVFLVRFLVRRRVQWLVVSGVLAWAVAVNASAYFAIILDGHVQNSFVQSLSRNAAVQRNGAFLVDSSAWPYLARHRRRPSTAQLNCLMKDAFGDEKRLAADLSAIPFAWEAHVKAMKRYRETGTCFREYRDQPPVLLTVTPGAPPSLRLKAKLVFDWIFRPGKYAQDLDGLISITVQPVPAGFLRAP